MKSKIPGDSIELLDVTRHCREAFSCGVESLDTYFRTKAKQDRGRFAAAVFVLAEGSTVIGYYTLSSYTIHASELPAELARRLPRYPNLPATLIGRLAVDGRHQKRGYGEELLMDALKRSLANTREVGSVAVVVEAENANAIKFYRSYGFIQFSDRPDKLFLPMQTIKEMFGE